MGGRNRGQVVQTGAGGRGQEERDARWEHGRGKRGGVIGVSSCDSTGEGLCHAAVAHGAVRVAAICAHGGGAEVGGARAAGAWMGSSSGGK